MHDKTADRNSATRPPCRARKAPCPAPCGAISASMIRGRRRDAGCRNSSMAIFPAARKPMPRCATTAARFDEYGFVPRVLDDVSARNQTTTLFGRPTPRRSAFRRWAVGAMRLPGRHRAYARGGGALNMPMILSGASLITLEDVRAENPAAWYQAYLPATPRASSRWSIAWPPPAYDTFVVTVDVPVPPNRENNIRSGFKSRSAITPRVAWDTLTHPRWLSASSRAP